MQTEVTTWSLEMLSPDQCAPSRVRWPPYVSSAPISRRRVERFLYTAAGGLWYWYKRLDWDYARWVAYLDRPVVETLVMYVSGTPAGYIELEAQADTASKSCISACCRASSVSVWAGICSAPGAACLDQGALRIWVHTCSLDGPNALANYQARGFQVFDQTTDWEDLPEATPALAWCGSASPFGIGVAMEQRPLGKTGLTVSALGFGCGAVGGLMVGGTPPSSGRRSRGRSMRDHLLRHRGLLRRWAF